MTPYYEESGITIYHGDCREILPSLPKVDLVLTDPPYGIGYGGGWGTKTIHTKQHVKTEKIKGDDQPFNPSLWLNFEHVAMFGAQHYYDRLPSGGTLHVWDKRGEYLPFYTADCDMIWINRKEVGRIFRCVWRGLCRETEHDQRIEHPTQKPMRVMRWLLEMFPDADVTLDPFMGSGTTLRAAKDLGRKAIGIEIEERYCEIAANRLRQEVLQFG